MKLSNRRANNQRNGFFKRRYLARRLEILRAAGREFRVRGFAETGMRDIAAAAALSPANLYNYFQGKHDILFFCQDNSLDRMINALDKARRMRASAAIKLRVVIVSLVTKRDKYEEGVRNLILAGTRSGEFAPCDPALAVRAILGSLNWSIQWFSPDGPLTAVEIAERFADYLIRGLLAKPRCSPAALHGQKIASRRPWINSAERKERGSPVMLSRR